MAEPIEMNGRLHGLARKLGKIGGEHVVYQITTHNVELWHRLMALAEGDVSISLLAQQGSLGLDEHKHEKPKRGRGRKKGAPTVDATAPDGPFGDGEQPAAE